MQIVTDLHLHSKYSRAVSKHMTLPVMADYAKQKGLDLLTASDWTHPLWFREIREQLQESSEGIYRLREDTSDTPTRFLLSTEISSIYKQGEKLRRIHNLVFVPNLETAEKVTRALLSTGANLSADGRPIIGLSSRNLLELILGIDERCMLIPCHVWTPHFGIYGSASGFDSLEEAFGDLAQYIYGIETGLSSDPEMNWQIPELKTRSILSFSDAHSPAKMGREATVFELEEITYGSVRQAIMRPSQISVLGSQLSDKRQSVSQLTGKLKTGQLGSENRKQKTDNRILYTIEFYPEEGKYHYSGHRHCKVSYRPEEVTEKGTTCPICLRKMTEGVMLRVQTLAGDFYAQRAISTKHDSSLLWYTDKEHTNPSYVKLVPLLEVVAESMGATVLSQKVTNQYELLCQTFSSELEILLKTPLQALRKIGGDRLAESIQKVREGNIDIIPGYDGEYGKVRIWKEGEKVARTTEASQLPLIE